MELNKMTMWVMGLVVGACLFGGLLAPIITDITATTEELVTEGTPLAYMEPLADTTEHTLVWTQGTKVWTLDGNPIQVFGGTILATQDMIVRTDSTYGQCSGSINATVDNAHPGTLTIEINNGHIKATSSGTGVTQESTYSDGFIISPNPTNWIMKRNTQEAYVHGDSEIYGIYAMGLTNVGAVWNNGIRIVGNANEVEISQFSPISDLSATFDNIVIHKEAVVGYVDTYKVQSIEFDENYQGTTTHVTYNYFIVPASIQAETTQHLDPVQIGLFGVIPIMGLIVIIVYAATGIRNKY